ncbi:MAG TPA: hypothetical protein VEV84_06480 [Pyrinomonadaceae bacterium]|jgi:hypothetical protein|nr:hypothetical protein [Pyrinomonadaceae bacterium]
MAGVQNQPNKPTQQGAPQEQQDMPSSGNSPQQTGASRGTDETTGGSQDVERSGMSGTGTKRAADTSTGDPGRTPGKAEGVESPEDAGNE